MPYNLTLGSDLFLWNLAKRTNWLTFEILQTMTVLLELLYKKKFNSKEISSLIAEPNNVETTFRSLTTSIAQILSTAGENAGAQKERALKLYLTILTGQNQFHENNLIENLIAHDIFNEFLQVSFRL